MIRVSKFAAAMVVLTSTSVFAQTAPSATPAPAPAATPAPAVQSLPADGAIGKFRQACAADVQKFCATAEKGRGKMRACLDSHAADLSAPCQTARAERASLKK